MNWARTLFYHEGTKTRRITKGYISVLYPFFQHGICCQASSIWWPRMSAKSQNLANQPPNLFCGFTWIDAEVVVGVHRTRGVATGCDMTRFQRLGFGKFLCLCSQPELPVNQHRRCWKWLAPYLSIVILKPDLANRGYHIGDPQADFPYIRTIECSN